MEDPHNPPRDTLQTCEPESAQSSAKLEAAAAKKLERTRISDSLNHQLEHRHMDKLVMLHGNVAPSLRAAQKRLEHNVTRDHVGRLLGARPDAEILTHRGITQPAGQAGRIQSAAKRLERNFTSNKIAHLLEHRAHAEDLQHKDILGSQSVASSIQRPQRDLQKNLAKSNLYHALKYRPSITELMKKGVYPTPSGDEVLLEEKSDGEEGDYEEEEAGDKSPLEYPDDFQSTYIAFQREYTASGHRDLYPMKRSKCFHLTRLLLKNVAAMTAAGELAADQKGFIKDLIVDQDPTILAVAETYDTEHDLLDFKDSIMRLAARREHSS